VVGDLCALTADASSYDAITAGYAFRNAPSLEESLSEMHRVLRPGGWLYTLDFYRPENRVWSAVYLRYLRAAGSAVGWWWHRAPVMYAYIADSIQAWVSVTAFEKALHQQGFTPERRHRVLLGGVCLHASRRR
jgi:demethylmenaquinone methyltransferase/2-methoxy-6-polyprenyl-1,4-benzoquinol methylase